MINIPHQTNHLLLAALAFVLNLCHACAERPNVILIMSDDQGVGDYGFMGNKIIRTPSLDKMHAQSGFLSNFYVSNVCAPTRASLMTGRYNYRTRCVDTYLGRAMMDSDEITLAEYLRDAGYRTGIYGKWHLGDNYPLRAMDQGFQDSLVHRGGGIGQSSDPIGAEGKYTDPTLFRNGREVALKGYCTDLYFDTALEFITTSATRGDNFFAYIATNAPHGPFHDVPKQLYHEYKQIDFSPIVTGKLSEKRREAEFDKLARIAAMVTNIDQNVGRLFAKLNELKILENTIVIYLNDNGPNTRRYVGDMRGMKTEVDDGGIRSPLLFHWPAKVMARKTSNLMCAHIDVVPTLLEACNVKAKSSHKIDGRSFLPLLTHQETHWPTRRLVFQSHRGNTPQPYHHFALHESPWKLVHPSGFGRERFEGDTSMELYNLDEDPRQYNNLATKYPEVVARLGEAYNDWFKDVSSTRENNFAPPRIVIGTEHESETVLTRQDWRHTGGQPWAKDSTGFWLLEAQTEREYEIELILVDGDHEGGIATVVCGEGSWQVELTAGKRRGHKASLVIPRGQHSLEVRIERDALVGGPHQVILTAKIFSEAR